MAEVYSLARARRRTQAPALDLPESLRVFAAAFGATVPRSFSSYYLKRTKQGTEVGIKEAPWTINLSAALNTYPPDFKAARQWIAAIAERQGWQMVETKSRI